MENLFDWISTSVFNNSKISIYFRNLDNLIGRAAHISFINCAEMLRTFCIAE